MTILTRTAAALRWVLTAIGAAGLVLAVWLAIGGPLYLDRLVIEQDEPFQADAIVCLGGGLAEHELPTGPGWDRIYTAVQLQLDGFAPVLIVSGGGTDRVSEAEMYAEAAGWLGADPASIRLEPLSASTAEHPGRLLALEGRPVSRDSRLIIVTSAMHSKRAAMCFRRAGFTHFRMVSSYVSSRGDARVVREARVSAVPGFRSNGKRYDDPVRRLRMGLGALGEALRELVAIGYYKVRGYV